MKKYYPLVLLLICCIFMTSFLISCGKSNTEQDSTCLEQTPTAKNSILLTASDQKQLSLLPPEPFSLEKESSEMTSSVTLTDNGSSLDTMRLYLLPLSKDYNEKDAKKDLTAFTQEYTDLAEENDGQIDAVHKITTLPVDNDTVYYADIRYSLDDTISYCAKFYAAIKLPESQDTYLLTGSIRVGEDTAAKFKIKDLLLELFSSTD